MTQYLVIWGVREVPAVSVYYTDYHAAQFAEALRRSGTPCQIVKREGYETQRTKEHRTHFMWEACQ